MKYFIILCNRFLRKEVTWYHIGYVFNFNSDILFSTKYSEIKIKKRTFVNST